MKGNGLSSTSRTLLKKHTRQATYSSSQTGYLAAKEKQKSLRLIAEKAQLERTRRELERAVTDGATPEHDLRSDLKPPRNITQSGNL